MSDFLISPGVQQPEHNRLRGRDADDAHPQYSPTTHEHSGYVTGDTGTRMYSDSTSVTTNASGYATITYPAALSTVATFIACNGSDGLGAIVAVSSFSTSSAVVQVFDSAGAFLAITMTINWIVVGT